MAGKLAAILVVLGQEWVLNSWLQVQRVPKRVRKRAAQRGFTRTDVACARTFKHESQNTAVRGCTPSTHVNFHKIHMLIAEYGAASQSTFNNNELWAGKGHGI